MDTGTHLIPEWAPQRALWVGWPHLREEWGEAFGGARAEIAGFVEAASVYVPVRLACGSEEAVQSAQMTVSGLQNIAFARVPTGDIWLRDTGPIIAKSTMGLTGHVFAFNGWGGKYLMPGDTETAAAICAYEEIPIEQHDFVLEGGAIDTDGEGRILTTRECLLHDNRNGWDQMAAEAALRAAFGRHQLAWLGYGLEGDHTDGHVDNLARFVGPDHVVCQTPSGEDDPQAARLVAAENALRQMGFRVSTLPSPGRIEDAAGALMPASHMNFVITNGAVIVPRYEAVHSNVAVAALDALFPDREVICLSSRHILAGGGSFHCMTREIPEHGGMT